jgi:hypothetical protein
LNSLALSISRAQGGVVGVQGLVSAFHHCLQGLLALALHAVEALVDEATDLVPSPHLPALGCVLPLLRGEITVGDRARLRQHLSDISIVAVYAEQVLSKVLLGTA